MFLQLGASYATLQSLGRRTLHNFYLPTTYSYLWIGVRVVYDDCALHVITLLVAFCNVCRKPPIAPLPENNSYLRSPLQVEYVQQALEDMRR